MVLQYVSLSHEPADRHTVSDHARCGADTFDAAMIVLAMYTLNFFHPGRLLGRADTWLYKEPEPKSEEHAMKGFSQESA